MGGYVDKVYLYDLATGSDNSLTGDVTFKYTGNFRTNYYPVIGTAISEPITPIIDKSSLILKSGENIFPIQAQNAIDSIIYLNFDFSNGGCNLSDLQIMLDGEYYTLKSAVENNKIKPLVLMNSVSSDKRWIGDNVVNLYDGGTFKAQYAFIRIMFMLGLDVQIQGFKISSAFDVTKNTGSIQAEKLENKILHLK